MANEEQLAMLKRSVGEWNEWRKENEKAEIDLHRVGLFDTYLRYADLRDVDLSYADLQNVDLCYADLRDANLRGANLSGANLSSTNLDGVNFSYTNLRYANLFYANLNFANLKFANLNFANLNFAKLKKGTLGYTIISNTHLEEINDLDTIIHEGPSEISIGTFKKSKGIISEKFLRGIGLDDWEIESVKLYQTGLSSDKIVEIIYKIEELRNTHPIQKYSVFLSHSSKDKIFTRKLQEALDAEGVRCWLDEKQLKIGQKIIKGINEGISIYDKSILICSKESLTSSWVEVELKRILKKEREFNEGKKEKDRIPLLLPIMLDDYVLEEWDGHWQEEIKERIIGDFKGCMEDEEKFNRMVKVLVKALLVDPIDFNPPNNLLK